MEVKKLLSEMPEPTLLVVKEEEYDDYTLLVLEKESLEREEELEEIIQDKLTPRYSLIGKNHRFPFPDGRLSGVKEKTLAIRIIHRKPLLTYRLFFSHLLIILLSLSLPSIQDYSGYRFLPYWIYSMDSLYEKTLVMTLPALLFATLSLISTCLYKDYFG